MMRFLYQPAMRVSFVVIVIGCLGLCGCGGPSTVRGGTKGSLCSGEHPISGIEVTVSKAGEQGWEVVGSGVSVAGGGFELRKPGATGPLWLTPGEYRITLASAGTQYLQFPKEYQRVDQTPLEVTWDSTDKSLDLDIPLPCLPPNHLKRAPL